MPMQANQMSVRELLEMIDGKKTFLELCEQGPYAPGKDLPEPFDANGYGRSMEARHQLLPPARFRLASSFFSAASRILPAVTPDWRKASRKGSKAASLHGAAATPATRS